MYEISLQKLYYTILSFSFKNYSNHSLRCLLVGPTSQMHLSYKGNTAQRMSCRLSGRHKMLLTSYFFYDWNDTIRGLHTIVLYPLAQPADMDWDH